MLVIKRSISYARSTHAEDVARGTGRLYYSTNAHYYIKTTPTGDVRMRYILRQLNTPSHNTNPRIATAADGRFMSVDRMDDLLGHNWRTGYISLDSYLVCGL